MFFISDLDHTLIYSQNAISNLNGDIPSNLYCAEIFNSEKYTFQTLKAQSYCKILIDNKCFIPATTRTIDQYRRLKLTPKKLPWVIAYNGAVILDDGYIDKEWNNIVTSRLKDNLDFVDMEIKLISYSKSPWLIKMKRAGSWFFYFIVDIKKLDNKVIEELNKLAVTNKWVFSQQGRKLYFIPQCLNKKEAASYILNKFNESKFIAAGDSILDKELLNAAIEGYIPSHGELYELYKKEQHVNDNIFITESQGIFCGEEILKKAIRKLGLPLVVRKKYGKD